MSATLWQELNELKERIQALEDEDEIILEEAYEIYNSRNLEQDLREMTSMVRKLVHQYGKVEIGITTER